MRACLASVDPQGNFPEFLEKVSEHNRSTDTICPVKDITSPTANPEPSHLLATWIMMPEPTADGESESAAMKEPDMRIEPTIAPEPQKSDQVCGTMGLLVEFEGTEGDPEAEADGDLEEDAYLNFTSLLVPHSSKSPLPPLVLPRSEPPVSPEILRSKTPFLASSTVSQDSTGSLSAPRLLL